jgi:phosphatidylglycerophosphate synthase
VWVLEMNRLSADSAFIPSGSNIARVYRATCKREDVPFNIYVCRPLAAVVVYWLSGTRVSPNQVSFFSLFLALVGAGCLVLIGWPLGLWLGVLMCELAYVFDKVDGMLARWRGEASPTGHLLDFLLDELKAFLILGALALGAYLHGGQIGMLFLGLVGVVCLASGIAMTTFQRRPEVLAAAATSAAFELRAHANAPGLAAGPAPVALALPRGTAALRNWVSAADRLGRFLIHYPSYIWLAALLSDARLYLYPYVAANVLYCARALFCLVLRYGGPAPRRI